MGAERGSRQREREERTRLVGSRSFGLIGPDGGVAGTPPIATIAVSAFAFAGWSLS
jgi:hypothetical protein